ncbi:MAG: type III secretion system chaperone [Kiritimatiellae bacterium]|nr:type III secretion system chaperone [Kiritimatiellia bacterium]
METKELIADLAGRLGIEFGNEGPWSFKADDIAVTIDSLPEMDVIIVMSDLGEPPPERLEGLYKTLLAANHLFGGTAGATISLDAETGVIWLCRALNTAVLDGASFYSAIERFVNTADNWHTIISDYRDAVPNMAKKDDEAIPAGGGFIQV